MFSHKVRPGQTQGAAELLFGKDAAKPWTERTATEEGVAPPPPPPPPPAAETEPEEPALERQSYRILRGRIISLPSLRLTNRQGQSRVFPWSYFGGAGMDHPGELAAGLRRAGGVIHDHRVRESPGRGAAARHRKESGGVDSRAGRPGRRCGGQSRSAGAGW